MEASHQELSSTPPSPATRDLPVLQERHVWIAVERVMPVDQPVYRGICPGSAIVAAGMLTIPGSDYVKIYYEGNLYRASNQHRYEERLCNAWGRLVYRYPTIAMMGLPIVDFRQRFDVIGTYDGKAMNLLDGGQEHIAEVQRAYEAHWASGTR